MTTLFQPYDASDSTVAVIKVIGVGGGGGNAIAHMIREAVSGVQFIAVNTDAQALSHNNADVVIQIGNGMTKGLGAGANPQVGRDAAIEDQERIKTELLGADMVFIAAGMGGGTGTGAAPIIAEIAKELGILTVAVVTKPFDFEGKKRMLFAEQGIAELSKYVDSVITIPNEKLLKVLGRGVTLLEAFAKVNDVLKNAVQGIAELITGTSAFGVNVDFADAKTVMQEMGHAMMGIGVASGEDRAEKAIEGAISSPLLDDIDLSGARGVLVNVTAGFDLRLDEFDLIGTTVRGFASEHATIVAGAMIDPNLQDEIRVTVVATGIGNEKNADLTLVSPSKDRMMPGRPAPVISSHKDPVIRTAAQELPESHVAQEAINVAPKQEMEYFDIPAFIRNQAD